MMDSTLNVATLSATIATASLFHDDNLGSHNFYIYGRQYAI